MKYLQLAAILLAVVALSASVFLCALDTASAAGTTYYVDGTKGNDANPGTSLLPWKTLQKATATIHSGDKVVIRAGIYRLAPQGQFNIALFKFGPAGTATARTIYKAAAGARVIITSTNNNPVNITLDDYVRLDGLWFGGAQDYGIVKGVYGPIDHMISLGTTTTAPIGRGKEVVNCTIWGYYSGLISGSTEYALIQGNRFLLNGNGGLYHGIYLSGDDHQDTGGASNHIIVDHNTLIGGGGYGIQSWHGMYNVIYTRNFVASHNWGTVLDGSDHLEANNLFWKENGQTLASGGTIPPWGPTVPGANIRFYNNVMGPQAWLRVDSPQAAANTFQNNAYATWSQLWPNMAPSVYVPRGTNQVTLTHGREAAQLGLSEVSLDNTLAALKTSFGRSVDAIYADKTIQANFAKLHLKVPTTSPLYHKGVAWFGRALNIGPDVPAPANAAAFWSAFRALGLKEYDRFGQRK